MRHAAIRRAFVALSVATTLVFSAALPAAATSVPSTVGSPTTTPEQEAVAEINAQRTAAGLPALKVYGSIATPAEQWALRLVNTRSFTHSTMAWRDKKMGGVGWLTTAENIAGGFTSGTAVVDAWMGSRGHRANILGKSYTGIGIAHVDGGAKGRVWVAIFGAPNPPIPHGIVPKLSGSSAVGGTVLARTAKWPKGTTFKYQWYADGKSIAGATSARFIVTKKQLGTRLQVKLMAYHPDYFPTSLLSKHSRVVVQP